MNLTVTVFRRPNLFIVSDHPCSFMGYQALKNLYTVEGYRMPEDLEVDLYLFYPERFLNVVEIRHLVQRIEAAGYAEVHITTASEHLLSTVDARCIQVIADELPERRGGFKLSNDYVGPVHD